MRVRSLTLCIAVGLAAGGCGFSDNRDEEAVANNDTAQTSPGEAVTINVLANDLGSDLAISSFQDRTPGGTVSKGDNETLQYRPRAGFLGTDVFTYVAKNGDGATSKNATVTVLVQ